MHPQHQGCHRRIVHELCVAHALGPALEAAINASHDKGCEEYGEWHHHEPEFDVGREVAEEQEDSLGLIAFADEAIEKGRWQPGLQGRDALSDLKYHVVKAHAAAEELSRLMAGTHAE